MSKWLVGLVFVAAACASGGGSGSGGGGGGGNNNGNGPDGGIKLDGGTGDDGGLGPPRDMAQGLDMLTVKLGCNGYRGCLTSEMQSNGGDFTAAETACKKLAKAGASQTWEALVGCGQQYCIDASKCKLNATQDRLVNLDDTAPADGTPCGDCLGNALASSFDEACPSPSSPDCTPSACDSALTACTSDTP